MMNSQPFRFLALLLPLALLILWIAQPVGTVPHKTDSDFDPRRAAQRLTRILGDQRPHPADSDAQDAVQARLLGEIEALGFSPIIRDQFHCNTIRAGDAICGRVQNILFWLTPPGDDAVVISAHYDSVPAGPGASDDGIGVAIALEVAHLTQGRQFKRPVLVLLTDGEESGLVGASAFAAEDPLASQVGAFINLEARGTTGRPQLFETSTPNGEAVLPLTKAGYPGSGNSLAADLYQLMPNATDLTMLLPLKTRAVNFAIVGGASRYHTPLDNIAHLDLASLAEMGAGTLLSVEALSDAERSDAMVIHGDFGGLFYFALPQLFVLVITIAGLLASITLYARLQPAAHFRLLAAPILSIVAGLLAAVLITLLVGFLRAESEFATAHPIAFRTALAAAALTGAGMVLGALRPRDSAALVAASWIWLHLLVLLAFAVLPGIASLTFWSSGVLILALIASFIVPRHKTAPIFFLLALVPFAAIVLPLAAGFEDALMPEYSAPAVLFLVLLFLLSFPRMNERRWAPAAGCAALLIAATIAALSVPAFSKSTPRHLNVVHKVEDGDGRFLIWNNGPLPDEIQSLASFAPEPDQERYWSAPAPLLNDNSSLDINQETNEDGGFVTLKITAPQSDSQWLQFENADDVTSLTINDQAVGVALPLKSIYCQGRTCREMALTLTIKENGQAPDIVWSQTLFGPGPAASPLAAARPDTAVPIQTGDHRVIERKISLGE